MDVRPFTIDLPEAALDDLRGRLAATRWPGEPRADGWQRGTELDFMRRLTSYWIEKYDWRAAEAALNRLHHYRSTVGGLDLHFVHERSGAPDATPIVLLHGWADSFYRFVHLIGKLTGSGFDVVVPSLPGFGFSAQPPEGQANAAHAADVVAELMEGLGYGRYVVHGGDWGSAVAQEVGRSRADRVIGLHLTDVPFPNVLLVDKEEATEAERAFLEEIEAWGATRSGYVAIQSTRPLTLSYGLSDSPIGLAAWLIDHFEQLSETMPSDDELITNVMLYWAGNTILSSMRYYDEGMGGDWDDASGEWAEEAPGPGVPTAIALFPKDIGHPPREFAERFFTVTRYTVMERGGHFAALEVPELVAADIRSFVADLR